MADGANSTDNPQALWESFQGSRDGALRRRLIEHYMPLARKVAYRTYRYAIQPCSFDDYLQYAAVGLIEAVDHYDNRRSIPFEVYSKHRIRGAILSGIGQESEAAAQSEFIRRVMPQRLASLRGGDPRVAGDASLQELLNMTICVALGVLLDRDDVEPADDAPNANPYSVTELAQLSRRTRALVSQLPDREREVIAGHYFEYLEFQVLAEQLGVSKSRISQLHAQGLRRLQQTLSDRPQMNRRL